MTYNSLWNLRNILRITSFKSQFKYASTQTQKKQKQDQNESTSTFFQPLSESRRRILFSPAVPEDRLQKLENITSVVIGLNHVSWAKIQVKNLILLDWDAITLPGNFLEDITETTIVETAHEVNKHIPYSELYIMERLPSRWDRNQNDVCLRSMLILLLSSISNGSKDPRIVFQKPSVLNSVHSLLVGGERTSAKRVLEKIYPKFHISKADNRSENRSDCNSLLDVQSYHFHNFQNYSKAKQESLSVALLLSTTFLEIAVFKNPESLSKIKKKHYYKTVNYFR